MVRIVNGLEEARAALRDGACHLQSPPYAACVAGVNYYKAMRTQLHTEFPNTLFTLTLCCGEDPAIAHDALRLGFTSVLCECSDAMLAQLGAIGRELGAVVQRPLDPCAHAAIPDPSS